MTDLDTLRQLLDSWGVPYTVNDDPKNHGPSILVGDYEAHGNPALKSQLPHPKLSGYSGFYTTFEFDKEGTFERMGAWE